MSLESRLFDVRYETLKPSPKINLPDWADEYRFLSKESSSEPGKFKTSRVEPARGPMLAATDPSVNTITIMAPTQLFKALALDTDIPTPNGWVKMGSLEVGDFVFDNTGLPTKVLGVSDVYTNNKCYKITFSDNTQVVADGGHSWEVDSNESENTTQCTKIINTLEIKKTYKQGKLKKRNRYAVKNTSPVCYEEKYLPIDPYVLGMWLGDGHSYSSRITIHKSEKQIFERLSDRGFDLTIKSETETGTMEVHLENSLVKHFCDRGHSLLKRGRKKELGRSTENQCLECSLESSKKYQYGIPRKSDIDLEFCRLQRNLTKLGVLKNKHIPEIYLTGSCKQRLDLLQGLMDSDGHCSENGRSGFTASNNVLAKDFLELICSFGLKGQVKPYKTKCNGKIFWTNVVSFTVYDDLRVFGLDRKFKNQPSRDDPKRRVSETTRRRITNVEEIETVPVKCITVDSPSHLFLCTRNYIPTHNTETLNNIVAYYIHQDPSPMILVQPTLELAEVWSKDRLTPMIRDTPCITSMISLNKGEGGTMLHRQFSNGAQISMVGANSPGSLAMRPVRIVLCDETDKYPASAGKEGDPIKLVSERSATFWNRLMVFVCSPTLESNSRIAESYERSDKRIYLNPCPKCDEYQEMKFESIQYPSGEPELAKYVCVSCNHPWTEPERLRSIQRGRWEATAKFNGHAGFTCSKLVSPWEPIKTIAIKYEDSLGKPEQMKTFVNTQLARTYKELTDVPDWRRLYERREYYKRGVIPAEAAYVTMGVDVQGDRLEAEIVAWGPFKNSWSIDYRIIQGAPSEAATWEKFEKLLHEEFAIEGTEAKRGIDMTAVDSGFATQDVYYFTRRFSKNKVMCIKGRDSMTTVVGMPTPVDIRHNGKRLVRGQQVWTVGSSHCKGELYGWLKKDSALKGEDDPYGYCHFPDYGEEFFKMLTAEEITTKIVNGYKKRIWVKIRDRNESLDCRIYSRIAASVKGLDRKSRKALEAKAVKMNGISKVFSDSIVKENIVAPKKKKAKIKRKKSSWV